MDAVMSQPGTFGIRLRERRLALGLTLAQLADRAGMHLQGVAKVESGARPNPTWETIIALCKALGVTPDYFYTVAEVEPVPEPPKPMGKRK